MTEEKRKALEKIQEIIDYYQYPAISQSRLKELQYGPLLPKTPEQERREAYEEKEHFVLGSAVDCKLSQGNLAFSMQYYVSQIASKPSDAVAKIIREYYDTAKHSGSEEESNGIELEGSSYLRELMLRSNYRGEQKWGEDAKFNALIKDGKSYYQDLTASEGRQILSQEENDLVEAIVNNLLTNPRTSHYFHVRITSNIEIRYQVPIYFEYRGHMCKALLDMLIIDHDEQTFTVVDFKTMSGYTNQFPKSLRDRRYDIQVAFYQLAVQSALFPDYAPMPPIFLVESTTAPGLPLAYECDADLIRIGRDGADAVFSSGIMIRRKLLGYNQLIDILEWYQANSEADNANHLLPPNAECPVLIDWEGPVNTHNNLW